MKRRLRVLHCPASISGYPYLLSRAERRLGIDSHAVAFNRNRFGYPMDGFVFDGTEKTLARELKRWRFFLESIRRYDVFHFNFGSTFMPRWVRETHGSSPRRFFLERYYALFESKDLGFLHAAGKGIVMSYLGDDIRQGDFCRAHQAISSAHEVEPGYYSDETDRQKRRAARAVDRHADAFFGLSPDLLPMLPPRARFLPAITVDLAGWRPVKRPPNDVPLVLHAPTHRLAKGTRFVVEAVERLRGEGVALDFVLVEKIPHETVRELYARADLLVDQLLFGWYGSLAMELMALGKPVVCYIRESDLERIPRAMQLDLPIIPATPATLHEVLREWLVDRRSELPSLGERSRAYMERWHDPLAVAGTLEETYEAAIERRSSC